jgi:WD40 repeat protein
MNVKINSLKIGTAPCVASAKYWVKELFISLIMMLGLMSSMVAMEPEARHFEKMSGQETIIVQTSDGQEFIISKEIAQQIPTINGLIEDLGESAAIPLPFVSSKEFDWIIKVLQACAQDPKIAITAGNLPVNDLIDVINASDYLGIDVIENELVKNFITKRSEGKQPLSFDNLNHMNDNLLKKVWDYSSVNSVLTQVKEIIGNGLIISSDENRFITYGYDVIKIWNLNNLDEAPQELPHEKVQGVVISPDGKVLISWSGQRRQEVDFHPDVGTIKIWNFTNLNQEPTELDYPGVVEIITDGIDLIARTNGSVALWHLDQLDEQPVWQEANFVRGSMAFRRKDNGDDLILWGGNRPITMVELNTFVRRMLPYNDAERIVVTYDGKKMITSSLIDSTIKIWNLEDFNAAPYSLNYPLVQGISLNSFETTLIGWSQLGNPGIKIWNLDKWNLDNWDWSYLSRQQPQFVPADVDGAVVSFDGNKLIYWGSSFGRAGMITLWDLTKKLVLGRFENLNVDKVIMTRDGKKLISSDVGRINIWDLTLLNEINNLNVEQMKLLLWLQDRKSLGLMSPELLKTFAPVFRLLPDSLKNRALQLYPVAKLLKTEPEQGKRY